MGLRILFSEIFNARYLYEMAIVHLLCVKIPDIFPSKEFTIRESKLYLPSISDIMIDSGIVYFFDNWINLSDLEKVIVSIFVNIEPKQSVKLKNKINIIFFILF